MMSCHSEQVVKRPVEREKALHLSCRFEATHLAFLLPGMLVGNFSAVVVVGPASVGDGGEDLPVRRRIASQLVGDELQRGPALVFQDLAKEALGSSSVSVAGDQDVEHVAILIHRSPKIMALAADRDEQLVHVPDVPQSTLSPPQRAGVFRSKLPAPGSNGFVGDSDATLRQEVLHVAEAEREAMVESHGMADDFGRKAVASIQRSHRSSVAERR